MMIAQLDSEHLQVSNHACQSLRRRRLEQPGVVPVGLGGLAPVMDGFTVTPLLGERKILAEARVRLAQSGQDNGPARSAETPLEGALTKVLQLGAGRGQQGLLSHLVAQVPRPLAQSFEHRSGRRMRQTRQGLHHDCRVTRDRELVGNCLDRRIFGLVVLEGRAHEFEKSPQLFADLAQRMNGLVEISIGLDGL
jgi:hypothetical protein